MTFLFNIHNVIENIYFHSSVKFLLRQEPFLLRKNFLRSLGFSEFLQEIPSGAKASEKKLR